MNLIVCCAIYKGDAVTERGLRTMSFQIRELVKSH